MSTIPGNSLEAPDEVHASRDGQRRDRAADPLIPGRPVAYLTAYALSILITAVCTALAAAMYRRFDLSNIIMVYLLGVVVAATRFGRGPAILSSILSVAAFDFCFVPPRWTLDVSDTQYLVTFAVMLVVSIVISTLTHRVREQAVSAQRRERRTAALLALTRELAATRGLEDILSAANRQIAEVFNGQAAILLPDSDGQLTVQASGKASGNLEAAELAEATSVFERSQVSGQDNGVQTDARAIYLPLMASRGTVGVLYFVSGTRTDLRDPENMRLLEAFTSQSASAIERSRLAAEARSAWERVEAEWMRNTLLSSVSHDLRTPLAGITGAAGLLLESSVTLTPEVRHELLQTIADESERMERVVKKLLEMTRLESGGVQLQKDWQPIQEVIGSALHHLDKLLRGREVTITSSQELPLVQVDAIALEQVLINLLENAVAYTPTDAPITITVAADDGGVTVSVLDRGPGLPPGTEQRVFDKFFRAHAAGVSETKRGIGLGLAICRGLVLAHGGTIRASNRAGGGADFSFSLPTAGAPPAFDSSDDGAFTRPT